MFSIIFITILILRIDYVLNLGTADRVIIPGVYKHEYELQINSTVEYIFSFKDNTEIYPVRVFISSDAVDRVYPLLVVAQQQKIVTSWQVPMITEIDNLSHDYRFSAHTLCPDALRFFLNNSIQSLSRRKLNPNDVSNPSIIVSTSVPRNVRFRLKVERVRDFFLRAHQEKTVTVSASEPVYYYYNFYDPDNYATDNDAVLVTATSESMMCMLFSIQNASCPIWDLESNIKYDSYWQTMSKQAAMVLTKRHYPHGFFVVMVVKHKDEECSQLIPAIFNIQRTKTVTIKVTPTMTMYEHNLIAYITFGIFLFILFAMTIGGIVYFVRTVVKARRVARAIEISEGAPDGSRRPAVSQLCFLSCTDANRNASNYVWLVTIVVLFYILPVLQVVVTYQGIVNDTGNDDICYYNFLCALPHRFIINITDFNHVLSNIGYIFLGVIFIILTHLKSIRDATKQKEGFGLMKPYGMFYSLGISLIMEGIMSASYHICPKKSNFQFDTSFMYVMTVLMIVNVYEIRKFDEVQRRRDERGYAVFFTLAGVTAISVLGSYMGTNLVFWIVFTLIHIMTCMFLTWRIEHVYLKALFRRNDKRTMNRIDIVHGILLVFINCSNIALAGFGIYMRYSFATHVLTVLITNGVLYTMFYIIMKMLHKERISLRTLVLTFLALGCWAPALYFFLSTVTTWEETPAQSRNLNKECLIVKYYDSHDIWHFLSAFALFFTCWILLTLDDRLNAIPTHDIVDFHHERRLERSNERINEGGRQAY